MRAARTIPKSCGPESEDATSPSRVVCSSIVCEKPTFVVMASLEERTEDAIVSGCQ